MIVFDKVTKYFDEIAALNDISMKIEKGTIYGLVGPNGSGKSTLMRIISGIYNTDGGAFSMDGDPVFERPEQKQKVFFVADEPHFFGQSTLMDMKNFYQRFYPRFDERKFFALRETFHLPPNKKISNFSKGMKRQAAFVLGLASCPEYLLLDECFDGLDPVKRRVVRKIISDAVYEKEMTVIISSHNLAELDEVCDTVGVLYKGELLYSKDLYDLKGEVHKVLAVFNSDVTIEILNRELQLMSYETQGKIFTLIVKGDLEKIKEKMQKYLPAAIEAVPLSLEEVFLYEMEVKGYDAKVIFQ